MSGPEKEPGRSRDLWHNGVLIKADEPVATGEFVKLTPEQEKARKRRNVMLALSIAAFMVLVFIITMTKIGETGAAP